MTGTSSRSGSDRAAPVGERPDGCWRQGTRCGVREGEAGKTTERESAYCEAAAPTPTHSPLIRVEAPPKTHYAIRVLILGYETTVWTVKRA